MTSFPRHSQPCTSTLLSFLILILIHPVTAISFVSNCPDVCTYRGSSNSLICTDVRYPRLPHILHCLNKNPLIREIALETVRFKCNCVWVRFLQLMRNRAIHVLPSRLTVMCYNTPRGKCDRVFMKVSLPVTDDRKKRQATESTESEIAADNTAAETETDVTQPEVPADGERENESVSLEESDGAVGEEILTEDKETDKVRVKEDDNIEKLQDDTFTQSYDGSVPESKSGSNATDILVVGFTNDPRLVVLEFGLVTGVISLTAITALCVWLSCQSSKTEPEPENSMLEVLMYPERFQHSNACLRTKAAPYRLTPLPPDGAQMKVHWVQATVPLGHIPGGITSHYP